MKKKTIRQVITTFIFSKRSIDEYKTAVGRFKKNGMHRCIVALGSARLKWDNKHMQEIEEIANLCAKSIKEKDKKISFISGGGPGVMEAWLKGGYDAGIQTGGMGLKLPNEQGMNKYCNPKFSYFFEDFDPRKKALFLNSIAYVVFEGGFGTLDELFQVLALMNTRTMPTKPIFVYPADFYKNILNFDVLVKEKTISPDDAKLITFCNTKEEIIEHLYNLIDNFKS